MNEDIMRIDEEIRRAEERKKLLIERKNKRLKELRAKQLREKEAWLKKFTQVMDRVLIEEKGDLYWYSLTQEAVCGAVRETLRNLQTAGEDDAAVGKEDA